MCRHFVLRLSAYTSLTISHYTCNVTLHYSINLPFAVTPVVTEHGKGRVSYEIKIRGDFGSPTEQLHATKVVMRVPVPRNAAKCKLSVGTGKAKYVPKEQAIVWKIGKMRGDASYTLKGDCRMLIGIGQQKWARPPITLEFQVRLCLFVYVHVCVCVCVCRGV
jgi:hypothetical protein